MGTGKIVVVGMGAGTVVAGALIAAVIVLGRPAAPKATALMGDNFYRIRRDALALFPRGSRLNDTAEGLISIGFRCQGVPHKMANINAESLVCDSHGRGYPTSPALNITVMARNGLISDFEVWNILQRADATTPEPLPPAPVREAAAFPHGEGAAPKQEAAAAQTAEAPDHEKAAHDE